jgi:hypothetical protein
VTVYEIQTLLSELWNDLDKQGEYSIAASAFCGSINSGCLHFPFNQIHDVQIAIFSLAGLSKAKASLVRKWIAQTNVADELLTESWLKNNLC